MELQAPVRILIIDDQPALVTALARLLSKDGFTVDTAAQGYLALTQIQKHCYDVVLCDLLMPGLDGLNFYNILMRQYPSLCERVIFLTGDSLGTETTTFLGQCGQPWLYKPFHATAIRSAIQRVLQAV